MGEQIKLSEWLKKVKAKLDRNGEPTKWIKMGCPVIVQENQ